ncbi:MAG: 2-amino-4-ketopentanoate thiolase [Candidatus Izimaplasma sp.]|nr:2-amino-4-ketopentanoate thiolase [Candidatus Izimaplasma bacterium]
MINKGSYVRIRKTLLKPEERSKNLPIETTKVPFKMWVKGFLTSDADLFDIVTIKTITGRIETGRLKEANPPYKHSYGDFIPEILTLRDIIKKDMYGDNCE